ncbi:secreted GGY protein, putative [Ixodes scapularis]|uniref:Secreted GGY protein, putative n=1 Tax=Ixodes scapularis TaxID=6945 RepID=B7P4L6_IXOSC|nr:secreted GGY protein, putative [Ixodes scapularis]|eukprot:XP_002406216.1 secreted GGY protein, putative [Ixodes scapularis]
MPLQVAAVFLGLVAAVSAAGFTAPSAYSASVYGPSIGSYGHGHRGYLPQAYNLQVRFGGGVQGHGGHGLQPEDTPSM